MHPKEPKICKRDALLGALGAFLMLVNAVRAGRQTGKMKGDADRHDASILKDEGYGHSVTVLLAAVKTHAARIHRISGAPLDVSTVSIPFPPPNLYCKDAELNPKTGLLCVFASGFCLYSVLRLCKEIKNISLHLLEQNPPLHAGSGDFRSPSRHLTVLGVQKRNTPPKGFRSA